MASESVWAIYAVKAYGMKWIEKHPVRQDLGCFSFSVMNSLLLLLVKLTLIFAK